MCGRRARHKNIVEYLALNEESQQQIYKMKVCNECFNTLDYLKDKKWMKKEKKTDSGS